MKIAIMGYTLSLISELFFASGLTVLVLFGAFVKNEVATVDLKIH